MGSPREVRLTRKCSLTPGFDDALGDRAQASYLREPDTHRKLAIDIEGNGAARGQSLRAPRVVGLPRLIVAHALHARVDE